MKEGAEREALHLDVSGLAPEEAIAQLIEHAATVNASDLFFVTNETHVAVQVRHLGLLRSVTALSPESGRRCMAAIKARPELR